MPQCEYVGSSGNPCTHEAQDRKTICIWHDKDASKADVDVKAHLEERARELQSCEGYELFQVDLEDAHIIRLDLSHANLDRANLKDLHGWDVKLAGASLFKANFENANLREAKLADANLLGANLNGTDLDRADFGPRCIVRNHKQADELVKQHDKKSANKKYEEAEDVYRILRQRFEALGKADQAGRFFFLEMVMRRKQMRYWSIGRFWSKLVDLICGYGEEPLRVIGVSLMFVLICALMFGISGIGQGDNEYGFYNNKTLWEDIETFAIAVYYSIVTFTTLGYGDMVALSWGKGLAALEAFVGVFLNSMFLLTLAKKMVR